MEINMCRKCSSEFLFKRCVCPKCGSREFVKTDVTEATALDFVHLIATPEPFPEDYTVVLFRTDNGGMGFCRTSAELNRGDRIKLLMDELGPVCEK